MPKYFDWKNAQKGFLFLVQKNLSGKTKNLVEKSKKCQESCQEIRENPRKCGKKQLMITKENTRKGPNFHLFW